VGLGLGSWADVARRVQAKALVVVAARDQMVNPAPALEFAKALGAETLVLDNDCGHVVFECDGDKIRTRVAAFLKQ
jgi:homoserine O-acetyltransferase/O-succinyltransferase